MINLSLIISVIKVAMVVLPMVAGVFLLTRQKENVKEVWQRTILRETDIRIRSVMRVIRIVGVLLILVGVWIGWLMYAPSSS